MDWATPSPPRDVVTHHTPGRESQSYTWIVETSGECLQGSRKQPVIAVYELDTGPTREFQAFVVVLVEAEASFVAVLVGLPL